MPGLRAAGMMLAVTTTLCLGMVRLAARRLNAEIGEIRLDMMADRA
jgi:hypothetical protein